MIHQDEKILFISNAKVIAIIRLQDGLETGFVEKKIVVTTRRCLMFESLLNHTKQMEYEVIKNKMTPTKRQEQIRVQRRPHLSVNQYPQSSFNAEDRDVKVVIDLEPSILSYINSLGIRNLVKNTTGMVILRNFKKQKFEVMVFPTLKDAFRFAKGLMCAKAWINYQRYCFQNRLAFNYLWVRILQQIVTHENSLTLIDPDLFVHGTTEQLKAFFILISGIQFAHSFQLRYSIVNDESVNYTIDFVRMFEQKVHSLNMGKTGLTSESLLKILSSNLKTRNLMKLNLENNKLTDRCFQGLQYFTKQNKRLSYINLSHNEITLSNFSNMLQFMKSTPVILNLDLSYNKIPDLAIYNIEKFILFALNPPIQQLDLSFNEFTQKGAWRLYLGFLKNFRIHVYLNFIVYPIPFKQEIFSEAEIDFPRKQQEINFNMHSALIEEFQQQSLMKHTLGDILVPPETLTIKFSRQLLSNVRLPKNKMEMSKTLQLSNDIENFMYSPQAVQRVYEQSLKMKSFPFQIPPRTRANFVAYLNKKLNEALLIRDHYSIKYILKSMKQLDIPYQGYLQRLERVQLRDKIFCKRLQRVLEFRHTQSGINREIDQLVKQGLRLYLQGRGIELLYYLKYSRDLCIQRLLHEKYNPEHQIYTKMAAKNQSNDQKVSNKEFYIPYEIKIQKRINQNFYLHPWQTNYLILSEMTPAALQQCIQFLEESQKRQTFAKYFQRIEERVDFIKNQFTLFTYKKFKLSYNDLKVNACRLLFLYKNIHDTHFFLQIPIYIKKRPITCQKSVTVYNPQQFIKKYHVVNYPNISYAAKMNHFYNYTGIITRYQSQTFQNEAKKMLKVLNENILKVMQNCIHGKKSKQFMIDQILLPVRNLIEIVRRSIYPQEIKEEIYLHLIGWRKGRFGRNEEVIDLIPWLTMYLKPPLQIEKYLVAAMLECKRQQLPQYPMCLVSDVNKPTSDDIIKMDAQFVQRDWLPPDHIMKTEIINFGRVNLQIHLLDKRKIVFKVAESMNVSQLMNHLMGYHELSCQDREFFWVYKLDRQTQQTIPLTGTDYVGEIVTFLNQNQILICRRRIYSRQLKYTFSIYGQNMIDSLFSQIKFDYMMRTLYDTQKNIFEITALYFIIDQFENFEIMQKKNLQLSADNLEQFILNELNKIQMNYPAYIPKHILARIMKDKETVFAQMKAKVSQKMLKKEHLAIYDMKTKFIKLFQSFPQFCSTNYKMEDNNGVQLKVFLNCMYIYVESEFMREYIKLQKIISIIPKTKYLLICYHKNQNIVGQLPLFSQQTNILAVSMDLLTYCLMRLKMVSNNLYEINKYERIQLQIEEYQRALKKVYNKAMEQKLFKNRQDRQNIYSKIMKMGLTLMELKELIYYNQSRYIKSYLDRKLYANKTERKMDYNAAMDEQQARDTENWHYNVFKNIFPQYEDKYGKYNDMENYNSRPKSIRKQQPMQIDPNDQYNQNNEYDIEFYSEKNKPLSVKKSPSNVSGEENYSPFRPTERKYDSRQQQQQNSNNYANPDDEFVSTYKKPTQQSKQPQIEPFNSQVSPKKSPSMIANQNPPVEEEQPVFSNKKQGGRAPPRRRQR